MYDDEEVMTFDKTEFGVGELPKSREGEDQMRYQECSCVLVNQETEVP
jgi:hypothetical protein